MKINKFKEDDIIVFDDKFYLCQIAGENECVFNLINIGGGGFCTTSASCGGIIFPSDISKFKYRFQNEQVKYIDGCRRFNVAVRNPIVGKLINHSVYLNYSRIEMLSESLYNLQIKKLKGHEMD